MFRFFRQFTEEDSERRADRRHRETIDLGIRQLRSAQRIGLATITVTVIVAVASWVLFRSDPVTETDTRRVAVSFELDAPDLIRSLERLDWVDSFVTAGVLVNLSSEPIAVADVDLVVERSAYDTEWVTPGNCRAQLVVIAPGQSVPIQMFVSGVGPHNDLTDDEVKLVLVGLDGDAVEASVASPGQINSSGVMELATECRLVLGY